MNLGLDATSLIYDRGVSRYTRNLIRALAEHTRVNLNLLAYSLRQKRQLQAELKNLANSANHQFRVQAVPPTAQAALWRLGLNSVSSHFSDLDIFHSWDWLQPPDQDLPLVSTIHDLAILKYPETAHPRVVKAHHHSWQLLRQRHAHIIAVSQATKKDVINLLGFNKYQVHVIPEALPAEIRAVSEGLTEDKYEFIKQQLNLKQPYLLFVGTREPRKNLKRLIQAWLPLASDLQLLIAGSQGWEELGKLGKHPQLRFLGKVSDEKLNVLYAEAEVFCYPSLYEGFGLPILEAFYHGTPVVTSNVSALIEVAGDAAELVDPESVGGIRAGIQKVLGEDDQAARNRLQRMIIRLQKFSWEQTAKQTVQVYQQAIKDFQD